MKKTILFGSVFCVLLMLVIPNIGAVEYNSIKQHTSLSNIERIEYTPFEKAFECVVLGGSAVVLLVMAGREAYVVGRDAYDGIQHRRSLRQRSSN